METLIKDISIVVPLLNEELNIVPLYKEIVGIMKDMFSGL